ncbi:MAG: hypothetical protein COB02_02935 [Candidatus Cloacimonadota bacterium]|nr:MAG: hypothetical protein COB02_02935 [Candidatus Cloacimonadota bacterium]
MKFFLFIILVISTYAVNNKTSEWHSVYSQLKQSDLSKVDPYVEEYKGIDPLVRYPIKKRSAGSVYLMDNLRVSRMIEEGISKKNKIKYGREIKWTSAMIDVSKLKRVSVVLTKSQINLGIIKPKTGHAQMLFEFEHGGVVTNEGFIDTLVISYEGKRRDDQPFNPAVGLFRVYPSIFVMGTFEDLLVKVNSFFNGMEIYDLELSEKQKRDLLENYLTAAFDTETLKKERYHTTRNSCVTNMFKLLNTVLPKERKVKEWYQAFGLYPARTLGSILPERMEGTLRKLDMVSMTTDIFGKEKIREYYFGLVEVQKRYSKSTRIFNLMYENKK